MDETAPTNDFLHRAETFGYDRGRPWAQHVFQLLFNVPRAYDPLIDAWETRHPGTKRSLGRLVDAGFVAYQEPVVVDTVTGKLADRPSRKVDRFLTTARGKRLLERAAEDPRELERRFPGTSGKNLNGVVELLETFHIETGGARFGLSIAHASRLSKLPDRTVRWWVNRLVDERLLRQLDEKIADVRAVVPGHFRVTRELTKQLRKVVAAFPAHAPATMPVEFRLNRRKFLDDVDPARVGLTGATDFDHDVITQQALAAVLASPRCVAGAMFAVEPRLMLPSDTDASPWEFTADGDDVIPYQPDASFRERDSESTRLAVFEYERFQSRRDAWSHVERFLGYLHTSALPFEPAVLRFVVDSPQRVRAYVGLIEAFADYALDSPHRIPANPVTLAVTTVERIVGASDPLDPRGWYRIQLPPGGSEAAPVLHPSDDSPYDEYFGRS